MRARFIAITYEGNPRNYEDKWYLFWLRWFWIWSLYIVCPSTPTAQDSSWALKGINIEDAHKKVKVVPASSGKRGDVVKLPEMPTQAQKPAGMAMESDDDILANNPAVIVKQDEEASGQRISSKRKGKAREVSLPEILSVGSQKTESGRANTVQRIPDTSIVACRIPDLSPRLAGEILARRLGGGAAPDAGVASSSSAPCGDTLVNPKEYFRLQLPQGLLECTLLQAEHKGFPSRQLPGPQWLIEFHARKEEGQQDATIQGFVYLCNLDYHSHQDEILLLATVGDYWTHSIMRRIPLGKDNTFQLEMDEWSEPVVVGSTLSLEREDVLLAWINEKFPSDFGPQLARRQAHTVPVRETTPEADPQRANIDASQAIVAQGDEPQEGFEKRHASSPPATKAAPAKRPRKATQKSAIKLAPVGTSRTTRSRAKPKNENPPAPRTVAFTRAGRAKDSGDQRQEEQ